MTSVDVKITVLSYLPDGHAYVDVDNDDGKRLYYCNVTKETKCKEVIEAMQKHYDKNYADPDKPGFCTYTKLAHRGEEIHPESPLKLNDGDTVEVFYKEKGGLYSYVRLYF